MQFNKIKKCPHTLNPSSIIAAGNRGKAIAIRTTSLTSGLAAYCLYSAARPKEQAYRNIACVIIMCNNN